MLGKVNLDEYTYGSSNESSAFQPSPRNPWDTKRVPGGSSGGSAAAVNAGEGALSLGTDTAGSIRQPAAFCGVVGVKPTYDRISRTGVIPLSPSLDHVGYFTKDTTTAKAIAPCIYLDWHQSIDRLEKPVLGVPEGPYLESASQNTLVYFQDLCRALRQAGYILKPVSVMSDFQEIRNRNDLILAAEAARVHADWFKQYEEIYAPKTRELILKGQGVSDSQLAQALQKRAEMLEEMSTLMESHSIDLWISPAATGPAPKGLDSTGDPVMNLPWTQAGLPTINLPAGKSENGLPLGLQVTGRRAKDEELLSWSEKLERVIGEL